MRKIVDAIKRFKSKLGFNEHTLNLVLTTVLGIFAGHIIWATLFKGGASRVSVLILAGYVVFACVWIIIGDGLKDEDTTEPNS